MHLTFRATLFQLFLFDTSWQFNRRIDVLDARDGSFVRSLLGSPKGTLQQPIGVAVVPSTGQLVVCDRKKFKIFIFHSITNDTLVRTIGEGNGMGALIFLYYALLRLLFSNSCHIGHHVSTHRTQPFIFH